MSLRDEIDALIEDFDGWQEYNAEKRLETADAIIALFHTHLESDEAVERAAKAMNEANVNAYGIERPSELARAALLAAMEEPHDKG